MKRNSIAMMMVAFFVCLAVLLGSLFYLTILKGTSYAETSQTSKRRELSVLAKRGSILDTTGTPLAYDRTSYDVNFYRDPLQTGERWRALYTTVILETIAILERNGNTVIDSLSIRRNEQGEYVYYWGNLTDAKALEARERLWRSNMSMPTQGAGEAFQVLRQRYMLPDTLDYEMAHKVLSIWQEVQNLAFKSYAPVTIASDVDASTVAEITQRANELSGMSAVQSYTRIYPQGLSAAHIVGYMSKTYQQSKLDEMAKLGYSADAQLGITGVEATMEAELSAATGARKGRQVVEVDSRGKVSRVIDKTDAQPGNNVVLTIDMDLQKVAEQALENNIKTIHAEQVTMYNNRLKHYQDLETKRGGTPTRFAKTGAVVVMNVNTGQVLALASYPSYDPNLFTGGISDADYEALNDKTTTPLFNKAISSRAEPGSIFKMVTGYAGLAEGVITWDEKIDCAGEYSEAVTQGKAPACWQKDPHKHVGEDIEKALKDSCNYYFFTVADRLTIAKLSKWADIFGLTSKTGIELTGEVSSHVANQQVLYDNTKAINGGQVNAKPYLVHKAVVRQLQKYGVLRAVEYTEEQVEKAATRIVGIVGSGADVGPSIRAIMREELDIPESVSYAKRWHLEISSLLYEITWNRIQTVITGIGQSVSSITPIGIARYISAIANGGTVYQASIIKRVVTQDSRIVQENNPKAVSNLNDTNGYLGHFQEGMREVISAEDRGTAAGMFTGFKYVKDMAAKTGTAQVGTIDIENTAWFVAYTPFVNSEIAIVVYIPNGFKGAMAAQAARDIIQFYRDRQQQQQGIVVPKPGGLVE